MQPGDNQLEPENLLSSKLATSRETVRKAMSVLIREGVITRWHGKGNFGHPAVTNLPMRIDVNSDFRRLLRNAGYKVKTLRSEPVITTPSAEMLHRMPESDNEKILAYKLEFYADNDPAIHVRVELLYKHVISLPEKGEYTEVLTESLSKICGVNSIYSTAWQRAGLSPEIASRFALPENTPLLIWDEVYYDLYDFKIGYVEIHFNPKIMDISMKLSY